MKIKFFASCVMTALMTISLLLPQSVQAAKASWVNQLAYESGIGLYEEDLGKMNLTVKTASLTQAQAALVTGFDVEWKAGTVYVVPTQGKTIKITQKGYVKLSGKEQVSYTLDEGILKVRDNRKKIEMFRFKSGESTIMMPPYPSGSGQTWFGSFWTDRAMKSFHTYLKENLYDLVLEVPQKQYEEFEFASDYASLSIKDMKISEVDSDCASGDVEYENVTFHDLGGETVNGSIILVNGVFENVELEAVNGELRLDSATVANLDLEVINGDIWVNQKFPSGKCRLSAVNGDIFAAPKQFPSGFPSDFKASVSNGDIHMLLPDNTGFYIPKRNVGNGDMDSEFKWKSNAKNYRYGDGKYRLNISCGNGDIELRKAR